ncbi:MAG: aldo/keto reductase [Proteobacteria bacterium]|nr:aldo/keto reductase [Pseudomonadota bacterium]
MRRVTLPGTDLKVSRLSFGTASLHHLPTSRQRQYLMATAFDRGFTHFDTAPYYGFGIAEEELGRFLRGRRGGTTIATKVGLYPPGGLHPNTASVWLRKLAGRVFPGISRPVVDWSISAASKSLDISLRRLGIDQIDLLLLHEPASGAVQSEVFMDWLKNEQRKGRIRAWGMAGQADCMDTWLSTNHPLGMVLQVRDSLERKEADLVTSHGRDLQITYGYLSSSAMSGTQPVVKTLELALRRNVRGSILVSTRRLAHVGELAAVAERADGETD